MPNLKLIVLFLHLLSGEALTFAPVHEMRHQRNPAIYKPNVPNTPALMQRDITCSSGQFECGFDGNCSCYQFYKHNLNVGANPQCCGVGSQTCCWDSGVCLDEGEECCGLSKCTNGNFCCYAESGSAFCCSNDNVESCCQGGTLSFDLKYQNRKDIKLRFEILIRATSKIREKRCALNSGFLYPSMIV